MSKAPDLQAAVDALVDLLEEPREPDGKIHPSAMWLCVRQAVLGLRAVEPTNPPDATARRLFRLGHMIHDFVQRSLGMVKGVESVYVEVKVSTPSGVEGSADGLLIMVNGDAWLLEFKSAKGVSMRRPPQAHHFQQAKTYAVSLKLYGSESEEYSIPPLGDSLKGIILVYVSKDDLTMKPHVVEYDQAWEQEIEDRVEEIETYRETGLPPCFSQTKEGKWYRAYCPYRDNEDGCSALAIEPDKEEDYGW